MPYAVYEIDDKGNPVDDRICTGWDYTPAEPIARITDAEMLALGRIRSLRFHLLMASALGGLAGQARASLHETGWIKAGQTAV